MVSKDLVFTLVEHNQDVNEGTKCCTPFARLDAGSSSALFTVVRVYSTNKDEYS